jgi:beta-galactosidase
VPAARAAAPTLVAPLDPGPTLLAVADALGEATDHERVPTFDDLGHDRGIAVFSTRLDRGGAATLTVGEEVRDRAWVLVDGVPVGVLARDAHERAVVLPEARGELAIVVEDQGRVDYGTRIGEHKGLIGGVHLDGVELTGWAARPIDLDRVIGLDLGNGADFAAGPLFARASFELDEAADLFLDTLGWGKGLVWVNGFLLGRYWRRGPQRTLIVPSPVTRPGRNDVVVLEFEAIADPVLRLIAAPELGHTEI